MELSKLKLPLITFLSKFNLNIKSFYHIQHPLKQLLSLIFGQKTFPPSKRRDGEGDWPLEFEQSVEEARPALGTSPGYLRTNRPSSLDPTPNRLQLGDTCSFHYWPFFTLSIFSYNDILFLIH